MTLEDNNSMNKTCYIYSMDETGMPSNHKQPKYIAQNGVKNVHGPSPGNKSHFTILACSNADGTILPLMIIFKSECLNYEWTNGEVLNIIYGMPPQGRIGHELLLSGF